MQPSLFDPNEEDPDGAARARADGIGLATAGAEAKWKTQAIDAVRYCAVAHPQGFTADDVLRRMAALGAKTINVPALGGIIQAEARAGRIAKTGNTRRSTIRRRHRDLVEWIGQEEERR